MLTRSGTVEIWLEWWTASNVDQPNNRLGYWIGVYALFGALAILSLILACWYVESIFLLSHWSVVLTCEGS
jgi:hypothetical protein